MTYSGQSPLEAILILLSRDFPGKQSFVDAVLEKLTARGRTYAQWMSDHTQVRTLITPNPQNPATYMATAMVQFRLILADRFSLDRVEFATFTGSQNVTGVILSHWRE